MESMLRMPALAGRTGAISEGWRIAAWLKRPGESFRRGETLLLTIGIPVLLLAPSLTLTGICAIYRTIVEFTVGLEDAP